MYIALLVELYYLLCSPKTCDIVIFPFKHSEDIQKVVGVWYFHGVSMYTFLFVTEETIKYLSNIVLWVDSKYNNINNWKCSQGSPKIYVFFEDICWFVHANANALIATAYSLKLWFLDLRQYIWRY